METTLLPALLFVVAALYASVGHGGASGYLAAMALLSVAPESMRPAALLLNVLVSGLALFSFARQGHFRFALLWPFALAAVPLAYLGGAQTLPGEWYRPLVGAALLYAALTLLLRPPRERTPRPLNPAVGLPVGGALGYLSGLLGVGGGIFLSPLMLFAGWGTARQVSAAAAAFVLLNSLAGLAGLGVSALPEGLWLWAVAAGAGGLLGATLGSRHLPRRAIFAALAAVLVVAGLKMLLS